MNVEGGVSWAGMTAVQVAIWQQRGCYLVVIGAVLISMLTVLVSISLDRWFVFNELILIIVTGIIGTRIIDMGIIDMGIIGTGQVGEGCGY